MLFRAALAADSAILVGEIVVRDDARTFFFDECPPFLVVGRAHDTVDRAGIQRIEQHDFSETVAREDLLPELDRAFQAGRHGEMTRLAEKRRRIKKR